LRPRNGAPRNPKRGPEIDYKKLFLDSFDKENFVAVSTGGWISMQKELFLTAIIPNETDETTFYTAKSADDKCIIGFEFKDLISENRSKEVTFYSGPEIREVLDSLAPNLSDTIDYGFLYYICIALFALISKINSFCSNWGLSIVLATVVIKIITYPLSLMAVKSKKKMSSISGKLSEIKEKYKDNPELYNQESMKLYKNANVNPFSGILSSLIPAPIFISLFWILNQSVELRMSSLFWIDDLSASDPYFILPALYSILMLIQQLYNNSAKLMSYTTLLPILFFALFSAMPAGVLLYFVTSSLISILTEKPQ
jgi:YidC/Oxa1 family membrane protein insertase